MDTHKASKIKVVNHINICKDSRTKLVRSFQHYKSKKKLKSTFVEASRYAKEPRLKTDDINFLKGKTVSKYDLETVEITDDD